MSFPEELFNEGSETVIAKVDKQNNSSHLTISYLPKIPPEGCCPSLHNIQASACF